MQYSRNYLKKLFKELSGVQEKVMSDDGKMIEEVPVDNDADVLNKGYGEVSEGNFFSGARQETEK